jgi:HPt (histidine-containing phosphotransfer) domain-containing protein
VADGDVTALRHAAHTLKGAIRYFGETPAYVEAYRIEQLARAGPWDPAEVSLDVLDRALENVRGELAEYLQHSNSEIDS